MALPRREQLVGERVRRRGLVLQIAAGVVVVGVLTGTVVGWRLLGRIDQAADRGVAVSLAALDAVETSLTTADVLLTGTRATVVATADTLDAVASGFDDATAALEAVAELSGTAAPALASAHDSLRTLQGVGRTIDATLQALSQLPFGPDYDPDQAFGATVARLVDDLEPLPATLQSTADEVDDLVVAGDRLRDDLQRVGASLDVVVTGLDEGDDLLSGYRAAAADARQLAEETGGGLGIDLLLGRVSLLLGGVALAVVQIVPFHRGQALRGR